VQNDLDELYFESQGADLRLQNCFNSLLMLSNSQFIENVFLVAVGGVVVVVVVVVVIVVVVVVVVV
jgi:hypothetical protein